MRAITAAAGRCVLHASHAIPTLTAHQTMVAVSHTAINRADTLQRKGAYPPPPGATPILGLECSGVVVNEGGRRVMALLPGGGYAESVAVDDAVMLVLLLVLLLVMRADAFPPSQLLMDVPESLSLKQAAAIPETWLTAFQLLFLVAQATPRATVLVHACGSGVGVAATQLAVAHGMTVIGTAGSEAKLSECKRLGASHGINYKGEGGFEAAVPHIRIRIPAVHSLSNPC